MSAPFTGILGLIAEELGCEVAEKLIEVRGGREVYVPVKPSEDSELAKIVGVKAAQNLLKLFGPGNIEIPLGNRRERKILDMKAQGMSHAQIAAELYISTKTVTRILNSGPDPRQMSMKFDETQADGDS